MVKTISIHSFRGGTGKSNTTANVSALLAARGYRVGVVDTDIQSPGIHVLFKLDETEMKYALNDYLWGDCDIDDAVYDVTPRLGVAVSGRVFLIPSSIKAGEIARVLKEGYDVGLLNDGFEDLRSNFDLDILMIDTHPGLNEETLLSIAISDALVIILRPDQQDYQGTGVTVEIARKLDVSNLVLLANKVPQMYDADTLKKRIEETYDCDVVGIVLHSDELMGLGSSGIFSLHYPSHQVTEQWKKVADWIEDLDV